MIKIKKPFEVKNPSADITWHKGAKRQMANLDRFIDELQAFDENEMDETTMRAIEEFVKKMEANIAEAADTSVSSHPSTQTHASEPHLDALRTLEKWIRGVLKYNSLMINVAKPLYKVFTFSPI